MDINFRLVVAINVISQVGFHCDLAGRGCQATDGVRKQIEGYIEMVNEKINQLTEATGTKGR